MEITFSAGTQGFGIVLKAGEDGDSAYFIRFEPARNRVVLDSWPRAGDLPFMVELERPLRLIPETPLTVEILLEGTVCELYVDDAVAMSARLYPLGDRTAKPAGVDEAPPPREPLTSDDATGTSWGPFVSEGKASFRAIAVAMTQA
jgi:hypothetical protein